MAGPAVLIAAFAGRAAALAARRAGFTPWVADLFADADTRHIAGGVRRVRGDVSTGFDEAALLEALRALTAEAAEPPIGLVYGAGFEDRPALLRKIGAHWPILGNSAETVEAVKQPLPLAQHLAVLGIAHPEIRMDAPAKADGWLAKRCGGAGGAHVARASSSVPQGAVYYQRQVPGRSVSVLFVSSWRGVDIVGFSEQWTARGPGQPFRFGGAVRPAECTGATEKQLAEAARAVAAAFGLKGLNSADFIVSESGWWLIEINPRLGATLDLFDAPGGGLFAAHIAAVRGEPGPPLPRLERAAALQVVYAPFAIGPVTGRAWPDWLVDRPSMGEMIAPHAPCCTVLARAETACEARRLCQERGRQSLDIVGAREWTKAS